MEQLENDVANEQPDAITPATICRRHGAQLWDTEIAFGHCLGTEGARHAVHGMIYAPWSGPVLKRYDPRAAIMMQMRFDGHIGFPGGIVDDDINLMDPQTALLAVTEAFKRELEEEINFDLKKANITVDNYAYSFADRDSEKKLFMHFFHVEITLEEFIELELGAMKSKDYGNEVMGNIRPTLYTMQDGYRGLPAFLSNTFIGSARDQLIRSLLELNIINSVELTCAMSGAKMNYICNCPDGEPIMNLPMDDEIRSQILISMQS